MLGGTLDPALEIGQVEWLCHFRERRVTMYYSEEKVAAAGHRILERLEEPGFWPEVARKTRERIRELRAAGERARLAGEKNSNQELAGLARNLQTKHIAMMQLRTIPNILDYAHPRHKNLIQERLENLLSGVEPDEQRAAHAFTVLTSWPEGTDATEEFLDALRTGSSIARNPQAVKILASEQDPEEKMTQLRSQAPEAARAIEEHRRKFEWLSYIFTGPPGWDMLYFTGLFSEMVGHGADKLEAEVRARQTHGSELEKEIARVREELGLEERDFQLFRALGEMVFVKTLGKEATMQAMYNAEGLFREIGRRAGLNLVQTQFFAYDELLAFLERGEPLPAGIATERGRECVMITTPSGNQILVGEEAKRAVPEKKEEVIELVDELHGTCASAGYGKGIVRIVNTVADTEKMQQGNILVSEMTNPDLVSAMKKAAAIVTDRGGLTAHAAIVSREFHIPCVVGTQFATKALKDGDEVEVDASKGIVRVLSRAG